CARMGPLLYPNYW
nr:immunoglobulin heavy chain junction region [Mus musculus]